MLDQPIIEITDFISFEMASFERGRGTNNLEIEVRVWHDDANGMQAEPVTFKYGEWSWAPVRFSGGDRLDQMVIDIVTDEYTDELLDLICEENPAFQGIPYDDHPVSSSEFQDMRI